MGQNPSRASGRAFIESPQEMIAHDPKRKLILRAHDKAVALRRIAIHKMVEAEQASKAAE